MLKTIATGRNALIAATVAIVFAAAPASAGDPVSCGIYAGSAVAQQQQNISNGCGFTGPRWHQNQAAHFSWCLSVSPAAANAERSARFNQLQSCTGGGGGGAAHRRCNIYALVAIGQQNANASSNCGFVGARWQTNYNAHYNWCRNTPKNVARAETQARMQQLRSCAP